MKKLILSAAIVCAAVISQAGTVSWQSGNLFKASSASGGWTSGGANAISKQSTPVYMAVFLLDDAAAYATASAKSQSQLWSTYGTTDITKIGDKADADGTTYNGSTYGNSIKIDTTASEKQYAVILATYHDQVLDKDFYIATTAESSWTAATSAGTAANIIKGMGDGSKSTDGWQAVPEPTSGLLLVLGMCGLALRRRRA